MEEVLTGLEDAAEKASGLEDLASLSQQTQFSESLHPSRPRPRAQVPPIDILLSRSKDYRFLSTNFEDYLQRKSLPSVSRIC